jgi:anti-sigma factor ChrR (cupin superfamily)
MRINADFSKRARVVPKPQDWIASPAPGVERLMLDRVGDEVARATSIVRYAAGCSFDRHLHAMGEEFLVLDGVFSDESGDYPAGAYVRNPPGTGHAPFSADGCRILVKLRQFDARDLNPVLVFTADKSSWDAGDDCIFLHGFESERVHMNRVAAGNKLQIGPDAGGAEAFVVSGDLKFDDVDSRDVLLTPESWLRLPPQDTLVLTASQDSIVFLKTGHLAALAGQQ